MPALRHVLIAALPLLAGCSSLEGWELLQHKIEIDEDDLDQTSGYLQGEAYPVDLQVFGFEADDRLFLIEIIEAVDEHPGLTLGRLHLQGADARKYRMRKTPTPAGTLVQLTSTHRFCGSPGNWLVAFPGMLPFVPIWRGYAWSLELHVQGWVATEGHPSSPFERSVEVEFRELNSRRSALFHLWPSTGFYGTQFVLGVFMAPVMGLYDPEETTPVLLDTLRPRLGRTFANLIYREVRSRHQRAN